MEGPSNQESDKISFWKKSSKAVPGRPSPKKDVVLANKIRNTGTSTSFQDFQASVSDAWEIDDDEFGIVSNLRDTKISKKVSQSAALNVLNSHRNATETKSKKEVEISSSSNEGRSAFPGYPQPMRCISPKDEDCESKLERFQALLESSSFNTADLCQLSWSGIPFKVRAVTWRLLSGYLPVNLERRQSMLERKRTDYWNLVNQYYDTEKDEQSQDIYRQIHIDIPRMNPDIALFQQSTVQQMFERILFIWAIRHPASSYVQGINDLVTPFYIVFLQEVMPEDVALEKFQVDKLTREQRDIIEADSFWCLSKFLDGIQDNYVFAQLGIQKKVNQLKELIQRVDVTLHRHLVQHQVDYLQFSFRWMNNLLTRELPLHCTIRLWDTYLAECDGFASFQLYVCAAFLLLWRDQLMKENDFQGLMLLLQKLPTNNWTNSNISLLVAEAYRLKYMFADAPNHLQSNFES